MIEPAPYRPEMRTAWDDFVRRSKNGTFLFERAFMDYHSQRFRDASLMFLGDGGKVVGLLPACLSPGEEGVVTSHAGLTYGGLVMSDHTVQAAASDMLSAAASYYALELGAHALVYKPVPYVYASMPSDEPLYWLFRAGAKLVARGVSSALSPAAHPKQRQSRRGGVVRAEREGVKILHAGTGTDVDEFHALLSRVLSERHGVSPVHSLEEMKLLMRRFPENISLYVARSEAGELLAGAWMFVTERVAHTQYIAVSSEGERLGAGDALIDSLIRHEFADKAYFDFGVSTERGGSCLNEGLIFQKEGFGARSVCYDTYLLKGLKG